jgi:hypothetical protein
MTETPPPSTPMESEEGGFMFVSRAEMAGVRRKVRAGEEPWQSAYEFLEEQAGKAMTMPPRSVMDMTSPDYPDHRFVADLHDRDDYLGLKQMGDAVLDLGLMHYLTEEDRYAERAIDLVYHWCLNPETYMAPNGDAMNVGPEIRIHVQVPKLWWGASFLRGHPYWETVSMAPPWEDLPLEKDGESAFRSWSRELMESMPPAGYGMRDNHWMWRMVFYASAAAYLREEEIVSRLFDVWRAETEVPKNHTVLNLDEGTEFYQDKDRPWDDYTQAREGAGYMKVELERETAYHYMTFDIEALSLVAEIARIRGVDLYLFNAPTDPEDGSTLRKLFNFMAPYAVNPSEWEWSTGPEGVRERDHSALKGLFELAHSRWRNREVDKDALAGELLRHAAPDADSRQPVRAGVASLRHCMSWPSHR